MMTSIKQNIRNVKPLSYKSYIFGVVSVIDVTGRTGNSTKCITVFKISTSVTLCLEVCFNLINHNMINCD